MYELYVLLKGSIYTFMACIYIFIEITTLVYQPRCIYIYINVYKVNNPHSLFAGHLCCKKVQLACISNVQSPPEATNGYYQQVFQ